MDALSISAASGMKARIESLEMLANNLANQASPGYKTDREFYSLYIAPEALESLDASVAPTPPTVPVIERHWTDFAQGALTATGNPLHVALSGRGFFRVAGTEGNLYTRNGSFRLSPAGRLETHDGFPVLSRDGREINLNPSRAVDISQTGELRQDGALIAQLGVVEINQPSALVKQAGTYFQFQDSTAGTKPAEASIHQGHLEQSNQSPAEGAVRLIAVMRQFEALTKAIQIGGEMNRRADEVARLAS
jgi:flagellar basal body rod protein FlgG